MLEKLGKCFVIGSLVIAPRDSWQITHYDDALKAQKPDGTNPTQAEIDAPTNSIGYIKTMNTAGLHGFKDWRLPTLFEAQAMHAHRDELGLVTSLCYWIADQRPVSEYFAWYWNFTKHKGVDYYDYRNRRNYVRLVRS